MRDQILAILAGYPVGKVEQAGDLWSIRVGPYAGARKDGISLANDLKAQYDYQQEEAQRGASKSEPVRAPVIDYHMDRDGEPVPVDIPMFLQEPVTEPEVPDERDARIAELEAKLAEKERQATDMFDAADLKDLMRENETHSEAQLRWQSDYNQLMSRLVDTRLTPLSDNERALLNRLQRALYAGRKGAVGMV